jgi:hypothetical protein
MTRSTKKKAATRSTKKKPARTKAKSAPKGAPRSRRAPMKTGRKTGATHTKKTRLTKTANGEPPVETRFQKGESGNPDGRPRGASLEAAIRRLAEMSLPRNANRSHVEAVAQKLWSKALRGDIRAIRIVLERIDGKVTQPVDVTMPGPALATIAKSLDAVYGKRSDQGGEEKH